MFEDDNNQFGRDTFGTPLQPQPQPDSAGATVPPVVGGNSYAAGGAIPDDDADDSGALNSGAGVADPTTDAVGSALKVVNDVMMYGRKKHGLPTDDQTSGDKNGSASDDEDDSSSGALPDEGADAPSYAEGGAIPDEEDQGESWQPPEDESAGLDTHAAPGQPDYANPPAGNPIQRGAQAGEKFLGDTFGQQGPIPDTGSQEEPEANKVPDVKRVISYLMGAGAAPQQQVDQLRAQAGTGNPDADNVLAVAKAAEQNGPDAAFSVIQANRQKYDAYMSHALAATTGVQGKPPDLRAAAESATKAYSYMPDGVSARFAAGPNGVTATVSPWGKQPTSYQLTPQQFATFANIAKDGQFDTVYEKGGAAAVLNEITQQRDRSQAGAPSALPRTVDYNKVVSQVRAAGQQRSTSEDEPGGSYAAGAASKSNDAEARRKTQADRSVNMGHDVTLLRSPTYDRANPDMVRRSQNTPERTNPSSRAPNENDSAIIRAERAYPMLSQGQQRAKYRDTLDNQEANQENKLAIAKAGGASRENVAKISAGSREKSSENTADSRVKAAEITTEGRKATAAGRLAYLRDDMARKAKAMETNHGDSVMRERGRMFGRELMAKPGASEADLAKLGEKYGINLPQGESAPASNTPQQRPANVPAGAKQYKGQWYVRGPNGESVPAQ